MSIIRSDNLYNQVERIASNFRKLNEAYPDTYLAAELINDSFDSLITKQLSLDQGNPWESSASLMVFGAYQSWLVSYILTSSGFHDISLMGIRRAIENACYLSKIVGSEERAILWLGKFNSEELRRKFSSVFSIPRSYLTDSYKHLRPMIVLYDYTSDFGAHANYETLVHKFKENPETGSWIFSLQNTGDRPDVSLGLVMLVGYRLIQSIVHDLGGRFTVKEEFVKKLETLSSCIRDTRIKALTREYNGAPPKEILEIVRDDLQIEVDQQFDDLVKKYSPSGQTA